GPPTTAVHGASPARWRQAPCGSTPTSNRTLPRRLAASRRAASVARRAFTACDSTARSRAFSSACTASRWRCKAPYRHKASTQQKRTGERHEDQAHTHRRPGDGRCQHGYSQRRRTIVARPEGQERFLRHAQQADGAVRRRIDIRLQPNRKEQEINMKIKRTLIAGLLMAVASTFTANVAAQSWPEQKIELIVGFAPGGGTDITARILARYLEKELGKTVVVINRPGASGSIGLSQVARAKPDGYTIGMTNMPGLVTLPIERDAGFTLDSFTFLGNLVRDPSAFSVAMDSKYKSLQDIIDTAKKEPGTINYGSTGVGTDDHLAMVLFERATNTKLNHVPYNGAGPLRTAVLGQHTEIGGMNL